MPIYQYKALTEEGKRIKGLYNANDTNEVISMLRQKKYYPVKIEESAEDKDVLNLFIFDRVKTKDIAVFCRQFYTMLTAGIPIVSCLDVLRKQTENRRFSFALATVCTDLQRGTTFTDALREHPKVFPELLINMIEAGEMSGNLDVIMNRMAIHYEKESKIENKIKGAMVYPAILSIASIFVIIFLLTFVMPTFLNMFQSSGVELPGPTRALLKISHTMTHYWYIYFISIILIVYGAAKTMESEKGKASFDRFKLKIPVVRSAIGKIITARFARNLSILLYSGIPLIQALESTGKVVGNKVVEKEIRQAMDDITKGVNLALSIKKINVFSPMMVSMVEIGEESGALDEILEKTANFYDDETEAAIQKMTTLVEPLMIVVMALIIGFIVLAMILPMFDMINTMDIS